MENNQNKSERNRQQDIGIARLEEKVDQNTKSIESLTGKVNNFWNDLGHLREDISSLKTSQKLLVGLMIAIFLSLIALFVK